MQRNARTRGGGSRERACKVCGGWTDITSGYGGRTCLSGSRGDYCSWRCLAHLEPVETWAYWCDIDPRRDPDLAAKQRAYKESCGQVRYEQATVALEEKLAELTVTSADEEAAEIARRYGGLSL